MAELYPHKTSAGVVAVAVLRALAKNAGGGAFAVVAARTFRDNLELNADARRDMARARMGTSSK